MANKNEYIVLTRKNNRSPRGLTLIEVIMVFGVIAIMAAVSIPIISAAARGARVRAAARKIALDVRLAKSAAVQQNAKFFVTFNATTNNYAVTCLTAQPATGCSGATPQPVPNLLLDSTWVGGVPGVVPLGTLFPGVTFTLCQGNPICAAVNPGCVGFSAGQGALIACPAGAGVQTKLTITNGGMTRTVVVNTPTGSTKVCDPSSPPCP